MKGVIRRVVSRGGQSTGAAIVEFALILPVLLILVLGIINFGYLFGQKLSLNQAVREGARMAVTPNSNGGTNGSAVDTYSEIQALVRGATGGLVTQSAVTVAANAQGAADGTTNGCKVLDVGDQLKVTATYPAKVLIPMPLPGFGTSNTFTLKSIAVYRCEWTGK